MSQPLPKADMVRTRARASSLSGLQPPTATDGPCLEQLPTTTAKEAQLPDRHPVPAPVPEPPTTIQTKTKTQTPTINAEIPAITPTKTQTLTINAEIPSVVQLTQSMDATLANILHKVEGMDEVKDALTTVKAAMTTLAESQDLFRQKYELDVEKHRKDIAQLAASLDETKIAKTREVREHKITKHQLVITTELNRRLAVQVNDMDNRHKLCNIRIDGKDEDAREDLKRYVLAVAADMGVDSLTMADLTTVYRVGKIHQGHHNARVRPRTIMVVFLSTQKRNTFFYSRSKLRNNPRYRTIYVNDDVTQITRKQREDYRSVAAVARADGVEVRIHTDGLILGDVKYLNADQHTLPERYSIEKAKTVEVGGELYFASEHSFMSNFAPSPIVDGNTVFGTAEHMYQAYKCRQAKELLKMKRVILAPTPLEAKRVADTIRDTPEWRRERDNVMMKVVDLKFDQNPSLVRKLLDTGDLVLNEATRNDHFGIGVPLHSREIKEKAYRGANRLGQILMDKRQQIRASAEQKPEPKPTNNI